MVKLNGSNFERDNTFCRFGQQDLVISVFLNSSSVYCISPSVKKTTRVALTVTSGSENFDHDEHWFHFIDETVVRIVQPNVVYVGFSVNITLFGKLLLVLLQR